MSRINRVRTYAEIPRPIIRKSCKKKKGSKLVKTIHKVINKQLEKKYFVYPTGNVVIVNTGNVYSICEPAQGTTDITRVGDTISPYRINVKLRMTTNGTAVNNVLRIIVGQFRMQTAAGTGPGMSQILLDTATYGTLSPLTNDLIRELKILKDFTITLTNINNPYREIRFSIRKGIRPVQFQAASQIGIYKLFVAMISDQPTNGPTISWVSETRYRDG